MTPSIHLNITAYESLISCTEHLHIIKSRFNKKRMVNFLYVWLLFKQRLKQVHSKNALIWICFIGKRNYIQTLKHSMHNISHTNTHIVEFCIDCTLYWSPRSVIWGILGVKSCLVYWDTTNVFWCMLCYLHRATCVHKQLYLMCPDLLFNISMWCACARINKIIIEG